jgi:hypothetical protein
VRERLGEGDVPPRGRGRRLRGCRSRGQPREGVGCAREGGRPTPWANDCWCHTGRGGRRCPRGQRGWAQGAARTKHK